MHHVERFRAVMNFQPVDRLPRWEWAMWWDETIVRWHGEGLPREWTFSDVFDIAQYFGHGPMISRRVFGEFLAPYYRRLIAALKELDILLIVDTDGDVTQLVPWLQDVGVAGVLPLERQAGVDGLKLREKFPTLRMVGHFNKRTMDQGEAAMRAEFERLRPLMNGGGFIPSVDHQTPPAVSIEQYRLYLRLLDEYVKTASPT